MLEPVHDAITPERTEAGDVASPGSRQYDTDWRKEPRGQAAASEDDVHEGAPGTPVSVFEGVDRLELRMDERRLHQRREQIVVHRAAKIFEQAVHLARRRRYEVGSAWIVVVAADPVLLRADTPGEVPVGSMVHQPGVDGDDLFDAEALRVGRLANGELHGVDVVDQLDRGRAWRHTRFRLGLGASHLSYADVHSLDPGRGDGFRSEQETGEWREV